MFRPPSEASPLLPGKSTRRSIPLTNLCKFACLAVALVLLLFPAYYTGVHLTRCPPDPATRDAIRRDWEQEQAQYKAIERLWQHKQEEQDNIERGWRRDTEQHALEVARRIKEELERQEQVRWRWAREVAQHERWRGSRSDNGGREN
ncbi:hypothetical protein JVU11DRAFT_11349 [Chiua virens]|nr:hypothetical protein JVU11DRAFT_11349 [Chiua virens]